MKFTSFSLRPSCLRGLLFLTLALSMAGGVFAADEAAAARKISARHGGAVVTVLMTLKSRVVVEGREMNQSDSTSAATATFIGPDGLAVLSYSATDPTEAMRRMEMGGEDSFRFSFETEIADLKIRLPGGREIPGEVVLRDRDLDLAFVRPKDELNEPVAWIDLRQSAPAGVLDSIVVLGRMGKAAGWSPSVSLDRVRAVVKKPRTFYVPAGGGEDGGTLGAPVFTPSGKILGLTLLRTVPGGGRGGMFFFQQDNVLQIILPAADVLETAAQVPPRRKAE